MKSPLFHLVLLWVVPALAVETGVVEVRGPYDQIAIKVVKGPGAKADETLFERQGYAAARDRFIQMDVTRRTGSGTLAELFGKKALRRDTVVHSIGIPHAAARTLERLRAKSPRTVELLQAYTNGVNRFLGEIPLSHPDIVRFYRKTTNDRRYLPAKWEVRDSLAIATALEFFSSSSMEQKLLFGAIYYRELGASPEKFHELLDMRAIEHEFILGKPKTSASRMPTSKKTELAVPAFPFHYIWEDLGFPFAGPSSPGGSNSWVVSRRFAGGKQSFLANDPHLPMFFPSTFQEIALDSTAAGGTFRVRGMSIPGIPGVFIGHNDEIAWGITNTLTDVDDVYIETMSPGGRSTKFQGRDVPLESTRTFVKVRDKDGDLSTKTIRLRWVPHHGPVISDHLPGVLLPPNVILSYKWAGHQGSLGLAGLLDLNRAKSFDQMKTALQKWESGPHNFIYTDRKGNIGYYAYGRYPVRPDPGRVVAPYLPVPGTGTYEWEGFRTRVPELYNPASGRIVTANNDPYGQNASPKLSHFEEYFGYRFAPGARAKRITELLDKYRRRITFDVNRKIQFDHKDLVAERIRALFKKPQTIESARSIANVSASDVISRVMKWDLVASKDSQNAHYFYTWLTFVMKEHFAKMNPKLLLPLVNTHAGTTSFYHAIERATHERPEYVAKLLEKGAAAAAERLSGWPQGVPPWGVAHPLILAPPLAEILTDPVTVPIPRDGSWFTVDVSGYRAGFPDNRLEMPTFYGANFRMIVAASAKGFEAKAVMPMGGKGSLDPYTGTQELNMWGNGELRDLVEFID